MATAAEILNGARDSTTKAIAVLDVANKKINDEKRWFVMYSVADLGTMTTPDDTITIDFTTPTEASLEKLRFTFLAKGTAGWRVRLIEAPTGGAATPTGQLTILNHDRNSTNTSLVTDGSTANQVNYDSTLATGGVTLWDEYLGVATGPFYSGNVPAINQFRLKYNTKYQLSLYGTDNDPATIAIDFYDEN